MCGLAGVLTASTMPPVSLIELRRMVAMVQHRGPDGYGLYRDESIGLAHARLSLVDLAGGAQPLANSDGTIWLSFNGEIFNYIELRERLVALGHRFVTKGDSEVIVHCYERFGPAAWSMLNGQFAFALWDLRQRKLWLVRDRLGILPLHYARTADHVVFASEAKAIFAGGRVAPRLDPAGLSQAFITWSAKAPRSTFAGVQQVPPATALCFDADLRATAQRYWRPRPPAPPSFRPAAATTEALEQRLQRAVALRMRADVPVGAYVSGGLDSSVLASLATDHSDRLETFGIRFEDPRYDETAQQRVVADHLGTRHHEILCRSEDIRAGLAETVWHCETPLLRTSPVPLFLLSGLVRSAGVKTVLTGEGADELLCGYTIFKEDQIRRFWARQAQSRARPALLQRIHHYVGSSDARRTRLWQDFFRRGLEETEHPFYSHLIRWQNTAWTLRMLAPEIRDSLPLDAMLEEMERDLPAGWPAWDPLTRAQYLEIDGFMSSYLLSSQGDRVAMAHGVEARYPFLDPDLVDWCFTLGASDKLVGTRDKIVLRRLARQRLPGEVCDRRKQPFRAPIGAALVEAEDGEIAELLSPSALAASGFLEASAATRLVAKIRSRKDALVAEREEMGLVGILTLQMLSDLYGRQFAARAQAALGALDKMECHVLVDRVGEAPRRMVC